MLVVWWPWRASTFAALLVHLFSLSSTRWLLVERLLCGVHGVFVVAVLAPDASVCSRAASTPWLRGAKNLGTEGPGKKLGKGHFRWASGEKVGEKVCSRVRIEIFWSTLHVSGWQGQSNLKDSCLNTRTHFFAVHENVSDTEVCVCVAVAPAPNSLKEFSPCLFEQHLLLVLMVHWELSGANESFQKGL